MPVPLPDHALRACHAALDMTRKLGRLREKWAAENRPRLFARVGLNTGDVLVGNLRSHRIMDYTVMGDHVNLASRLEGANKPYGTSIMVSEFTWAAVASELIGRELDRIAVKGKERPVRVYEVIARHSEGIPPDTEALLRDFASALALYQAARFADALAAFEKVAARYPEDGPTRLYVERCREYLAGPAPSRLGRGLSDEDQVAADPGACARRRGAHPDDPTSASSSCRRDNRRACAPSRCQPPYALDGPESVLRSATAARPRSPGAGRRGRRGRGPLAGHLHHPGVRPPHGRPRAPRGRRGLAGRAAASGAVVGAAAEASFRRPPFQRSLG